MGTRKVYKSASTGRFVSKRAARRSPSTTYAQTVRSRRRRRG